MQLGIFTKDASTGILSGSIRTLSTTVDHVEIAPSTKRSKESPDFRVYGPTACTRAMRLSWAQPGAKPAKEAARSITT